MAQYMNNTLEGSRPLRSYTKVINPTALYEIKSNNMGLRLAKGDYVIIIQNDMQMLDFGFDRILLSPMLEAEDILAVSGRCADNDHIQDGILYLMGILVVAAIMIILLGCQVYSRYEMYLLEVLGWFTVKR